MAKFGILAKSRIRRRPFVTRLGGYEVDRLLRNIGHDCMVVAPSLIPKKAGQRVKTDRRDSLNLARLHRAGELTGVWVPDAMNEALRDLTRAREDMKHLQRQAKQRLLAFLLRHGWTYSGKSNWTKDHFNWLETVKFQHAAQQIVFQEYVDTVKYCGKRVESVTQQIEIIRGCNHAGLTINNKHLIMHINKCEIYVYYPNHLC